MVSIFQPARKRRRLPEGLVKSVKTTRDPKSDRSRVRSFPHQMNQRGRPFQTQLRAITAYPDAVYIEHGGLNASRLYAGKLADMVLECFVGG
jgi:hypothetical protein